MNFQNIKTVSLSKDYLNTAFSRAKKIESSERRIGGPLGERRMIQLEAQKAKIIMDSLSKSLNAITSSFPNFNKTSEFYSKLISTYLDIDKVKQHLGLVQRAESNINKLGKEYTFRIKRAKDKKDFLRMKNEYFGRTSSIIKKLDPSFIFLENSRKKLKNLPDIKDFFTVCLAGFPNVGKSTLLSKITSSKPEIKDYAFTTKILNTGYFTHKYRPVQVIDTPGTLARFEKMNEIEKQSFLAIRYEADLVIFIYDLTNQYAVEEQDRLLKSISSYDKPIIYYISKTDITPKKVIDEFLNKKNKINFLTSPEDLKKSIIEILMNSGKNNAPYLPR